MSALSVGSTVMFSNAVVKRSGHSARVAKMRGVILNVSPDEKIASVDCGDTFISDEGKHVRGIPLANLVRVPR